MRALLFGNNVGLMSPVAALLSRAGFGIDLVTCASKMIRCSSIENLFITKSDVKLIDLVYKKSRFKYDLIVPCDDESIGLILNSSMSEKEKLRILPIVNKLNIVHLFSKIGLSNTFAENGINTPNYFVANNEDDIIKAFCSFKGGFFIKLDSSGGGLGVFPCDSRDQFEEIKHKIAFPVLVQEKIEGDLIDLSGFFQNGKLVYFGYAEILESRPDKFGPSVLRRYHKLSGIDVEIFDRLGELGQALGANGFVNIGSVRSAEDGKIYFIEADMRPTAWVEHQKFFEEDPAVRIKDYFLYGRTLSRDDIVGDMTTSGAESTIVIPYFHRMDRCEIIENKYNCHSFRTDYLDKKVEKWWHRPLAELFLTLGRVFHVGTVRTIGDRIWDTYIE